MKVKILLCAVLGLASFAHAENEFCKVVPVITGEFASETLFNPKKTQVTYEKVCNLPEPILGEFKLDPETLPKK